MAKVVPTTFLHFLHPWRSDAGGRTTSGTVVETHKGILKIKRLSLAEPQRTQRRNEVEYEISRVGTN
jgi:hypothetical protein